MEPLIIIGSGLAGYTLAREFRKLDNQTPLRIITADDGAYYSKPMLSNAIDKNKKASELINANAEQMVQDLDAQIMTSTRIVSIDVEAKTVTTDKDNTISYHNLILAIGATPITPVLQGNAVDKVLQVNNLTDYRCFREAIHGKKNIAIIGPGLIGCEFANDLLRGGFQVSVIGPGDTPLGRLLPEPVGNAMRKALSDIGVHWQLGTTVTAVDHAGDDLALALENGDVLNAEVALSAIGLRPDTSLADSAGLHVNRGVVVTRDLKTSDENIYALGDCAEVDGLVLPFVMPLMQAARALAKTLAGEPTMVQYPAMPVVVKTPDFPLVVVPPPRNSTGEWVITRTKAGIKAMFNDVAGNCQGFALSGEFVQEKQLLSRQLPLVLE